MSNRELFDHLFATGRMHLTRGPLFDTAPPALPATVDPDKIEACCSAWRWAMRWV